ncbi:MAG: hypothetical protein EBT79_13475 [Actinobacteria bacterium]|nr:hypothetical protein [Actinomycetota bacterium]NBR68258.1 hypothetical protein [Actinomycetota bacterium]
MKDFDRARRQLELRQQADDWIRDNPDVYARFVELAREKVGRCEQFSIAAITEVVRWDATVRFAKGKDFAISNSIRRYIALRMVEDHPEFEPYITTKAGEVGTPPQLTGKLRYEVVDDDLSDLDEILS